MNLIITHTPLQCLIAEKIIKLHPKEKFYCICFSHTPNKKSEFYFSRLKSKCTHAKFIKLNRHILFFIQLFFFRIFFLGKKFDTVFLASIDSLFCHTILSSIKKNHLKTFDDGSANIIKNGIFYHEIKSIKDTLTRKILCINYNMPSIKKKTEVHFTIYKDLPNIVSNTKPIQLIKYTPPPYKKSNEISILLGQPLYPNKTKNQTLFQDIVNKYKFEFYFPHPRENFYIENIHYIETNLIFEHYLIDIINEYSTINIYTFFSSVALNINRLDNVHIHLLNHIDFKKEIKEFKKYLDSYQVIDLKI